MIIQKIKEVYSKLKNNGFDYVTLDLKVINVIRVSSRRIEKMEMGKNSNEISPESKINALLGFWKFYMNYEMAIVGFYLALAFNIMILYIIIKINYQIL